MISFVLKMKKLKFILPVLLAVSLPSKSQPYISFPTDKAYWSIDYTMPEPFGQIFHMDDGILFKVTRS